MPMSPRRLLRVDPHLGDTTTRTATLPFISKHQTGREANGKVKGEEGRKHLELRIVLDLLVQSEPRVQHALCCAQLKFVNLVY